MPPQTILKIAVAAPLHTVFDYLPPKGCVSGQLMPGVRVAVPFGKGERCGVLVGIEGETTLGPGRLKPALAVLDRDPLFAAEDLSLLRWAARYYQHPLGEVIASALPVRLRRGESPLDQGRPGWRLTAIGAVQDPAGMGRAPRQAEIIRLLREEPDGLAQEDIYLRSQGCRSVLRNLERKGWLESVLLSPQEGNAWKITDATTPALNADQQSAIDRVAQSLGSFSAFLLDGVTGSGKTEVYLKLVERLVAEGRQVLILVPEIGLTPQLLRRFQRRIPAPVLVLHSGLTDVERERAWQRARQGPAGVVLGTRSAVFTPMPKLGLIVVDEEHDLSLKQQEGFRYSARDMAVVRAQRAGCPVLLGSATPSLESLRNALEGRYHHLRMPQRAGTAVAPSLDLLDIRSARLEAGVSPALMRITAETLDAGNQVLLFLNRRGYAPIVTCHACGWVAQCRRCDARMTLHLSKRLLWCHHCGSQRRLDAVCPECGEDELRPLGQGTERLQEVLEDRFSEVGIARIDRDSTRRKGSLAKLLGEIREGRHSLLLGTQMLAKGHHFPDVTLVGILDVDHGLFGADYRAAERMAQLIVQVAGRSGRAEKPGRVIIQTRHPDHPLLRILLHRGYDAFAEEALSERRAAGLPPYSHQVLLRAEAHHESFPLEFLLQAAELGKALAGRHLEFWGPVPAPMERRAGRYRAHLLVQSAERTLLQRLLGEWLPQVRTIKLGRKVRWSVDVDPQEMF